MSALQPITSMSISFEEWVKQNDDLVEDEYQNVEIECDECNGTGIIEVDDKNDYRFKRHLRDIYDRQTKRDAEKLEQWNRIMREEAQP